MFVIDDMTSKTLKRGLQLVKNIFKKMYKPLLCRIRHVLSQSGVYTTNLQHCTYDSFYLIQSLYSLIYHVTGVFGHSFNHRLLCRRMIHVNTSVIRGR